MRRIAWGVLSAALLTVSWAAAAQASLEPINDTPYMTSDHSTTPKTTFGWDETPFSFIQFDRDDLNINHPLELKWTWHHEAEKVAKESAEIFSFPNNPVSIWNSLVDWNDVKQVGDWSVRVAWHNRTQGGDHETLDFTVTPEPLSAGLFLIGAPLLAAGVVRRKKLI